MELVDQTELWPRPRLPSRFPNYRSTVLAMRRDNRSSSKRRRTPAHAVYLDLHPANLFGDALMSEQPPAIYRRRIQLDVEGVRNRSTR